MERDHVVDPQEIYDAHPDGIGEVPAEGTPVHTSVSVSQVKTEGDLRIHTGRFGRLRNHIDSFRENGLSVGLKVSTPGQIDVFVASHRDSIKKAAAVGAAAGAVVGAVVYMHHHKGNRK
jgi:hypothetical protein